MRFAEVQITSFSGGAFGASLCCRRYYSNYLPANWQADQPDERAVSRWENKLFPNICFVFVPRHLKYEYPVHTQMHNKHPSLIGTSFSSVVTLLILRICWILISLVIHYFIRPYKRVFLWYTHEMAANYTFAVFLYRKLLTPERIVICTRIISTCSYSFSQFNTPKRIGWRPNSNLHLERMKK